MAMLAFTPISLSSSSLIWMVVLRGESLMGSDYAHAHRAAHAACVSAHTLRTVHTRCLRCAHPLHTAACTFLLLLYSCHLPCCLPLLPACAARLPVPCRLPGSCATCTHLTSSTTLQCILCASLYSLISQLYLLEEGDHSLQVSANLLLSLRLCHSPSAASCAFH